MPEMQRVNKKRKLGEDDKTERFVGKLHHHVKEVRKAAKKAKAFETQKLVKKLKGSRAKLPESPETAELEAQLAILKKLDHEPFANTALKSRIHKDKLLAGDEHLTAAVAKELSSNLVVSAKSGSNEAKVQSRLLSSKIIATEVATVIDALKIAVSPELKKSKTAGEPDEATVQDDDRDAPPSKKARKEMAGGDEDEDESDGEEGSSRVSAFSDAGEADGDGWESGSVYGDANEDNASQATSDAGEEEAEGDDDDDTRIPLPSKKPEPSKKANSTASAKTTGASTFLPSLSVGFTRGDSDASDISDDEAGDVAPKKNRRGQRARRAIWEKKYGKNANHVQKQQDVASKGRRDFKNNGGAPRPQAEHSRDKSRQDSRQPPHASQALARPSQFKKEMPEDKPLHPSWEAKKRMKEKQSPGIVPPQGKKIVF